MRRKFLWGLATALSFLLAACSTGRTEPTVEAGPGAMPGVVSTVVSPTETAPPPSPPPAETPLPAPTAAASPIPTAAAAREETEMPEPTDEPQPVAVDREPILPIGAAADWTTTNDAVGIEGQIKVTSLEQIVIRDFIFLAAEAPGVDIRLGIDDDFNDGVGVSLKDITGKTYEGRTLTLTIPGTAYDGRSFNSIGVFCFDTGDLFDYATFKTS